MARAEADQLQQLIEKAKSWPVWQASGPATNVRQGMTAAVGSYGKSAADLQLWVAMREGDRDRIRELIPDWPKDRQYRIDPLADRISQAFSDLLFGEDPEIKPADEADEENLEELINANDLPSELRRAAADASSEGETWYRIYTDPEQADRPLVEFHSRLDVVPLFRGRRVVACAFVSHLATQEIKSNRESEMIYWRHVEIQTDGMTRNLLYRGNLSTLGDVQPLKSYPDTAEFPEEWDHGLDVMLAGRIMNKVGRDWRLGLSDYQNIKDLLLDLNEARTIMAENARLTAKSRMVVPLEAVKDGKFDAGSDVLVHETLDQAMGDGSPGPYAVLQYTFEADALTKHINELRSSALTGVGLMEQFVGSGTNMEGNAGASGTSLKTRLIPTTLAASGRGRFWDDEAPQMLKKMQMVDELPTAKFGFAHKWADAKTAPSFERSNVLPEDPMEEVERHVAAVGGEIESIETAVKDLHPDWDEKAVEEEIKKIKDDRAGSANNFGDEDTPIEPGDGLPGSQPQPGVPPGQQPPPKPAPGVKPPPKPAPGRKPAPARPPGRTPKQKPPASKGGS